MSATERKCGTCLHWMQNMCVNPFYCDGTVHWKPRNAPQEPAGGATEDYVKPATCHGCAHIDVHWKESPCQICDGDCMREPQRRKHSHYFKDVSGLATVDVYRVLELFDVTNPAIAHAAKKLLCAGRRGAKDQAKDIAEAIDTLTRWQEMRAEDQGSN